MPGLISERDIIYGLAEHGARLLSFDDQRAPGGRCCSGRIRLIEGMDRRAFLAGAIAGGAAPLAAHAQ